MIDGSAKTSEQLIRNSAKSIVSSVICAVRNVRPLITCGEIENVTRIKEILLNEKMQLLLKSCINLQFATIYKWLRIKYYKTLNGMLSKM